MRGMHPETQPASPSLPDYRTHPRAFLKALFDAAVHSAQPLHGMCQWLPEPPSRESGGRTLVLGAGKAGGAMAQALEALWPQDAPLSGLVVTRYGHVPPRPAGVPQRIEVVEAAHPVPDAAGLAAAQRILDLTQGLTEHDLVLCLISGGGSSLLTLPCDGVTLEDKQRINRALLDSGAHIGEMNCVRKHLSRIKGGRLTAACAPARVVTLTISDVPGDDPSVIASGPTVPDATTCADALAILARYGIDVPPAIRTALEAGRLETPKPGDARFAGHSVHMIATPQQALEAAAALARSAGLPAHVLSDEMEGESREVGKVHAALARAVARRGQPFAAPCVILSGARPPSPCVRVHPACPGGGAGVRGSFAWAWRRRCRASPPCGRWRPTPTASTAAKTMRGPLCAPTRWCVQAQRACASTTTWRATTPGDFLRGWTTCWSPAPRTPT